MAAVDSSSRYALIAVQGPARSRRAPAADRRSTCRHISYYWFAHGEVAGVRGTISRTGYTGEDGFEIFVPPNMADARLAGAAAGGQAAGVDPVRPRRARHAAPRSRDAPLRQRHRRHDDGARSRPRVDRRLEQAAISSAATGCVEQKARGVARKLVGFEMVDRGIARQGYAVLHDGDRRSATVTSGTQTPFLKKADRHGLRAAGARRRRAREIDIDIRGRAAKAARRAAAVLQTAQRVPVPKPGVRQRSHAYPADLKYTKDHEWVRVDGDTAEVGITDFAQQQLGDVVYVELPEVGRHAHGRPVVRHDRIGEGGVGALRAGQRGSGRGQRRAQGHPEAVNSEPHETWMVKVRLSNPRRRGIAARRRRSTRRSLS